MEEYVRTLEEENAALRVRIGQTRQTGQNSLSVHFKEMEHVACMV